MMCLTSALSDPPTEAVSSRRPLQRVLTMRRTVAVASEVSSVLSSGESVAGNQNGKTVKLVACVCVCTCVHAPVCVWYAYKQPKDMEKNTHVQRCDQN